MLWPFKKYGISELCLTAGIGFSGELNRILSVVNDIKLPKEILLFFQILFFTMFYSKYLNLIKIY